MRLVTFLKDFDYTPSNDTYITIAYKFGMEVEVEEECADRAVASGAALYLDFYEDDEREANGHYNFSDDEED